MQKNQERKPRNKRRGRAREFVMNHDRDHAERGVVDACDLPMSRSTASVLNPRDWALIRRREMSAASVNGRSFRRGISLDYVTDHPPNDIMRWPRRTADPQRGIERSIRGLLKKVASRHAIAPVTETLSVQLVEKLSSSHSWENKYRQTGAPGSALDESIAPILVRPDRKEAHFLSEINLSMSCGKIDRWRNGVTERFVCPLNCAERAHGDFYYAALHSAAEHAILRETLGTKYYDHK